MPENTDTTDAWRVPGGHGRAVTHWHADPDCQTIKREPVPADPTREDLQPCRVCVSGDVERSDPDWSAYRALMAAGGGENA